MKKSLLYITLMAFLAGPMLDVPVAEASSSAHPSHASKSKTKSGKTLTSKSKARTKTKAKLKSSKRSMVEARAMTPLRAASTGAADATDLDLHSSAAIVVDQKTGAALYAKNVDIPAPIASITKLMTAMVTLDAGLSMDEEITITNEDVDRLKGTSSRLPVGTRLTRGELMHLALIASENRAAAALSRAYPGGRDAFVAAMNQKAKAIGMKDTRFVDGTGLNSDNRATAADLVKMVDAAYRYPMIREITRSGAYDLSLPVKRVVKVKEDGRIRRVTREVTRHVAFHNTNALTRDHDWDIGISKTGYLNEAGRCLVMQAKISEKPVIIVLLDSWGKWSRIGDANRIKKWLENGNHMASQTSRQDSV
jgi:D-alanyl-D-alanine endopeptidase (penicillin-binding protein 7)